jgi:hypothetical protein
MVACAAALSFLCGGAMAQTMQPDQKAFDQIGEQIYGEQQTPGFAFLV